MYWTFGIICVVLGRIETQKLFSKYVGLFSNTLHVNDFSGWLDSVDEKVRQQYSSNSSNVALLEAKWNGDMDCESRRSQPTLCIKQVAIPQLR